LVGQTLDYRARNGDEGALLKDVGKELEGHLSDLAKKRGEKGAVKGKERGAKWQEVRDLRKEHRQREGKVVGNVVKAAQVSSYMTMVNARKGWLMKGRFGNLSFCWIATNQQYAV
jgi:hypothetical protein